MKKTKPDGLDQFNEFIKKGEKAESCKHEGKRCVTKVLQSSEWVEIELCANCNEVPQ